MRNYYHYHYHAFGTTFTMPKNELLKKERRDASGAVTKGANLSDDQASQVIEFLKIKDLDKLKTYTKNPISIEGIQEIEDLYEALSKGKFQDYVKTNFSEYNLGKSISACVVAQKRTSESFDYEKAKWINHNHIKILPSESLLKICKKCFRVLN